MALKMTFTTIVTLVKTNFSLHSALMRFCAWEFYNINSSFLSSQFLQNNLINYLTKVHFLKTSYWTVSCQSVSPVQWIHSLKQAIKNVSKVARNAKDRVTAVLDYGSLWSHNKKLLTFSAVCASFYTTRAGQAEKEFKQLGPIVWAPCTAKMGPWTSWVDPYQWQPRYHTRQSCTGVPLYPFHRTSHLSLLKPQKIFPCFTAPPPTPRKKKNTHTVKVHTHTHTHTLTHTHSHTHKVHEVQEPKSGFSGVVAGRAQPSALLYLRTS